MSFVVTLIAGPQTSALDQGLIDTVTGLLHDLGFDDGVVEWLDPGRACDIGFDRIEPDRLTRALRALLADRPVDFGVQATAGRRKRLLVADMDATIVTSETLDELAEHAGLKTKIAAITGRAMAGELDFAAALRERVGLLAGLPVVALEETLAKIALTPGAGALVRTMRANGAYTVLVSGGFTQFTETVGARADFDETHGNLLAIEHGRLTGSVAEPILGQDAKLRILEQTAAARGIGHHEICSVGDGANDAAILAAAGLGVAYHGKPPAKSAAKACIDHGDLTALLYLQGYRRDEFYT